MNLLVAQLQEGFSVPAGMSDSEYGTAEPMTLRCEAASVHAIGFAEGLLEALPWAKPIYQKASIGKRRTAIRALYADLLRLEVRGLAGYHGMHAKDFPASLLGFGYDVFDALKNAMVSAGLLTVAAGRPKWISFDNAQTGERGDLGQRGGFQARFRLTPKALQGVADAGITLDAWSEHWSIPAPIQSLTAPAAPTAPLIELRAAKVTERGRKRKGYNVAFDMEDPALKAILADLQAHNSFLAALGVGGVDFIGLRRIFNDGDQPGFTWNLGGRFYSLRAPGMGKAYEVRPGEERRSRITLGGANVAEADMSASQLRLLYALLSEPIADGLEADLYSFPGVDRVAVKLIVTQAIGKESVRSSRWGGEAVREYRKEHPGRSLKDDHPFADALAATVEAHPILGRLGSPGVPSGLMLQFIEAEIVRRAMGALRSLGIGSLPVHDSLIVPLGHLETAESALQAAFKEEVESLIGRPTQHRARVKLKGL